MTQETQETQLDIGTVNSRLTSTYYQKELQKCKDSFVYFYNKYVRKEGQKELTEAEYQRNMPLKLPDFLKNDR